MKKTIVLGALLLTAAAGFAQESRQDISVSGFGLVGPQVHGNDVTLYPSRTGGVLLSYRYLLTPHSGLEANYSFAQNTNYYTASGSSFLNPIHTRQQELTVAYVYGFSFRRYNPFLQAGVGVVNFTPIQEGTATLDAKTQNSIGGLVGGGVAYELSPSFDLRLEYRGLILKAPDFKLPGDRFKTGRYELVSMPAIGIAYHF